MKKVEKVAKTSARKRDISAFNIVVFTVLLLYCLFFLFLIVWGAFAALKPVDEFDGNMLGIPHGWPWEWAWSNFRVVFRKFNVPITIMEGPFAGFQREVGMLQLVGNTLLYTLPSALIATFIPCLAAYLTAKYVSPQRYRIYHRHRDDGPADCRQLSFRTAAVAYAQSV